MRTDALSSFFEQPTSGKSEASDKSNITEVTKKCFFVCVQIPVTTYPQTHLTDRICGVSRTVEVCLLDRFSQDKTPHLKRWRLNKRILVRRRLVYKLFYKLMRLRITERSSERHRNFRSPTRGIRSSSTFAFRSSRPACSRSNLFDRRSSWDCSRLCIHSCS
jgi:hypothetical protein